MGEGAFDSCSDLTVLVVDDEPDMRVLVRDLFTRSAGFCCQVEEAADGHAGLDAFDRLRAAGHRCVLVVDLQMPDIDGLRFAQLVLQRVRHQQMILLTGYCTDVVRAHASRIGFAATLMKTEVHDLPAVVAALVATS
ncbi:MAG TPA: response regulator [Acidimicrobiales bacterium]|nr:response regulator [Acidimicrobiales bacterium]